MQNYLKSGVWPIVAVLLFAAMHPVSATADLGPILDQPIWEDTLAVPILTKEVDELTAGLAVGAHTFASSRGDVIQWESRAGWHHGYDRGDSPHFTIFSRGATPDAPSYSVRIVNWEPSIGIGEHRLSREGLHLTVNVPGPEGSQRGSVIDDGVLVIHDIVDPDFGEFPTYVGEIRGQSSVHADEPDNSARLAMIVLFNAPYTSPY